MSFNQQSGAIAGVGRGIIVSAGFLLRYCGQLLHRVLDVCRTPMPLRTTILLLLLLLLLWLGASSRVDVELRSASELSECVEDKQRTGDCLA